MITRDVDLYVNKAQQRSIDVLKELCCSTPVLAYYHVMKYFTIQCDAFRAHDVTSDVAKTATIRPERDVQARQGNPQWEMHRVVPTFQLQFLNYIKPFIVSMSMQRHRT